MPLFLFLLGMIGAACMVAFYLVEAIVCLIILIGILLRDLVRWICVPAKA